MDMMTIRILPLLALMGVFFQCSTPEGEHQLLERVTGGQLVCDDSTLAQAGILLPFTAAHPSVSALPEEEKKELINRLSISKLFSDNMAFTENKGQLEHIYQLTLNDLDDIKFYTKGFGGTAYFSPQGVAIGFIKGRLDHACEMEKVENSAHLRMKKTPSQFQSTGFTILFEGGNDDVKIHGEEEKVNKINYFRGKDPSKYITDISNYSEIRYEDLYDQIDLKYYLTDRQLRYDYIIKPGGDINDIQLSYVGAKHLAINAEGALEIETDWGILKDKPLYSYQLINGQKKEVKVSYVIHDEFKLRFSVRGFYDKRFPLVIDPPTLTWSTFIGGNDPIANGYIHDVALDASGNIYGTGWYNDRFPMNGAFDNVFAADEQVVFKLNAAGTTLLYSSFIGGGNLDYAFGVVVDAASNAYVGGYTLSSDFPTTAGVVSTSNAGGIDITVTKINPAGNALVYSTYYGGSSDDRALGIAINPAGEAYVSGRTSSTTAFSTAGAYQTAYGGGADDAYILKLSAAATAVQYCTYYGGSGDDLARDIAVNSAGVAYIVGATTSTANIASAGSFDAVYGGGSADGFIAAISNAGNTRVYGAYAGGVNEDKVEEIALKSNGEALLLGYTRSYAGAGGFPSVNAFQANNGAPAGGPRDAFMMRVDATGATLLNATFIGTALEDMGRNPTVFDVNTQHKSGGIAVNDNGDIAVAICTDATTLPTVSSVDATFNGDAGAPGGLGDVYIAVFSPAGNTLSFSTYLGGSEHDYATGGIHFDPSNPLCIIVGGSNHSNEVTFPITAGSYLTTRGTSTVNDQGFVTKYCDVVLPVELLSFTARILSSDRVITEWKTAMEKDNDYFLVQRSVDGISFETIGRVKGAGHSNQVLAYAFIDEDPLDGVSYYRLVQVDYDGSANTSQMEMLRMAALDELIVSPNPGGGVFTISTQFSTDQTLEFMLTDAIGKQLMYLKTYAPAGFFQKTIDLSTYSEGMYMLNVKNKTEHKIIKLIKQ
jgi:hypothetical protein